MACSASEIYAARSSIVGSIGVIGGGFGFVEVAEKIGVRTIFWDFYLFLLVLEFEIILIPSLNILGGEEGFHSRQLQVPDGSFPAFERR